MSFFTDCFVRLFAFIYRTLKWLEFSTYYYVLSYPVEKRIQKAFESIGVVFHFTEDNTHSDEKKVRERAKFKDLIYIKVHKKRKLFCSVAATFSLGLGEGALNGEWECDPKDMPELSRRAFRAKTHMMFYNFYNRMLYKMYFHLCNLQTESRAWEVGVKHYDIGNELFESFLDPWLQYTCSYFGGSALDLNQAQIDKMDLIAKKLCLTPGQRVLDIGCGWGTLCKYLAEKYEVECVGITVSKEGAKYAQQICSGLPVEILLQDYRSLKGKFDRIVSVGMFEHVGSKNHRTFFKKVHELLTEDGIFLLHTIGRCHETTPKVDLYTDKYIFANSEIPGHIDIAQGVSGFFVIEDWHNFGFDYSKTLEAWYNNFVKNWPKLEATGKYDKRFYLMWITYLRMAQGLFAARALNLFQVVLTKDGLDYYRAAR